MLALHALGERPTSDLFVVLRDLELFFFGLGGPASFAAFVSQEEEGLI
jgi:hypothetical protein